MRLAKILTIAVVLTGLLSGCNKGLNEGASSPSSPSEAIVIEYWTPFSGGDNQFMTEMVERFNAEQDAIEVTQTNSRLDDYYSRLQTAILSGNPPDVAIIHTTSMPQFVQNGYVEDLSEPMREIGLDGNQFNPNILKSTVYNNKFFAVPLDTHGLVMYYNKAFLKDAGVLDGNGKPIIEAGPEGFEKFLQRIKAAVPGDVAPLAVPSTRIDSVWLWWSFYNQMAGGGKFYNQEGTKSVIDNPLSLKALNFVHGLYRSRLIPPNINDAFKMFSESKAAIVTSGMWGTGAFEHVEGLDFGVVPLPQLYDKPAAWGDSHNLAIPKNHEMTDDKRKAIMTFTKWLVEHGEMWAEAGHVPSLTKVVHSEAFNALEYRSDYAAAANYVVYWPRHVGQWSAIEILIHEFERMNYNELTPEQTLRNAALKIDAELKS